MNLIAPLFLEASVAEPLRIVLAIWMAFLGGCAGSFMNVVVYRLPLGKSLVYPGSACPACGRAIRWYHNLPVLGWLVLRGKCYDCGRPIAARYPIIEGIVASMFLAAALLGPLSADHLPEDGVLVVDPLEWAALGYRLLLLCTLLCRVLIEWDRPPEKSLRYLRRMWWGVVLIGLVAPLVWPELLVWRPEWTGSRAVDSITAVLCGAAGGFLLGRAAWPATGLSSSGAAGHRTALANLVLIGAFLGLPLVCVIGALAAVVNLVLLAWPRPRGAAQLPWSFALFPVTVIGAWCAGAEWLRLELKDASWLLLAAATTVLLAAWIQRALSRSPGAGLDRPR